MIADSASIHPAPSPMRGSLGSHVICGGGGGGGGSCAATSVTVAKSAAAIRKALVRALTRRFVCGDVILFFLFSAELARLV